MAGSKNLIKIGRCEIHLQEVQYSVHDVPVWHWRVYTSGVLKGDNDGYGEDTKDLAIARAKQLIESFGLNDEPVRNRLNRLAKSFYGKGWALTGLGPDPDSIDFSNTNDPVHKYCYQMAELAYEEFMGKRPDYSDEEL